MNLKAIQERNMQLTPVLFALFALVTPLSPSLRSIFLVLALVSVLFNPNCNQYLIYAFNTYWARSALLLVGFVALACLWSPAPFASQMAVLGKYSKLLYLPIFAVGFINPKTRTWSLNAYLAAMVITAFIALLKSYNIIPAFHSEDVNKIFYNHIVTGFMMASACYIAALEFFKSDGKAKIVYVFVVFITSYQILFLNTGRTGYVIYLLLMGVLCLQKLSLKKALIGLLGLAFLMLTAYGLSPTMQAGVKSLINDTHSFKASNATSSIGFRFRFHEYAQSLFLTHPVIGIGTGAFQYSYARDQPVEQWGDRLNEPHSQYWLTLSEQGIIGFIFLFGFLGSLFWGSIKLSGESMILGLLIAFCFGAFSDSILFYSPLGFLLIFFSALNFGEIIEKYANERQVGLNPKDEVVTRISAV